MDNLKSDIMFLSGRALSQEEIRNILLNLSKLEGITSMNVESDFVSLEYYQHIQSQTSLKDSLVRAGFPFKSQNRKSGFLKKFIKKLGNENKKSFGNKRLECCDLEQ
jgi:hypothetical protein